MFEKNILSHLLVSILGFFHPLSTLYPCPHISRTYIIISSALLNMVKCLANALGIQTPRSLSQQVKSCLFSLPLQHLLQKWFSLCPAPQPLWEHSLAGTPCASGHEDVGLAHVRSALPLTPLDLLVSSTFGSLDFPAQARSLFSHRSGFLSL